MAVAIYPSMKDFPGIAEAFPDIINISSNGELNWFINERLVDVPLNFQLSFDQYEKICKELILNLPIFSRFFDDLPNINLHIRDLAICVLKIARALKNAKVNCVVMRTASSHHIDSLMLEAACKIYSIKLVFLNLIIFENRLLPIIQNNGIISRKPLGFKISDHSYNFEKFIKNSKFDKNLNLYRLKNNVSIIPIVFKLIINKLRVVLKNIFQPAAVQTNNFSTWTFRRELVSMISYKQTRKYLEKKFVSKEIIEKLKRLEGIVILAHFEPEATNFPEGGRFHNILDLVIKIRSSNYEGAIILKEHPMMKYVGQNNNSSRSSIARSKSLIDNLIEFGVFLVDADYKISNKQICLTLTGTVALERSLEGQRTIVLGHPWFKNLPGTVSFDQFLAGTGTKKSKLSIKTDTIKYLESTLNSRTLDNIFDIGTGVSRSSNIYDVDSKSIKQWKTFFNQLQLI